jgi:hypothetical protein
VLRKGATQHYVVDTFTGHVGMPVEQRLDDLDSQVVGPHAVHPPPLDAHRAPNCIDNDTRPGHEILLFISHSKR